MRNVSRVDILIVSTVIRLGLLSVRILLLTTSQELKNTLLGAL